MKGFLVAVGIGMIMGGILGSFAEPTYTNMAIWFIGYLGGSLTTITAAVSRS